MRGSSRLGRLVLAITAIAVLGIPLFGQSVRGSMSGRIDDPSGGVIPGASVAIKNTATGEEYTTVSDSQGNYVFTSIGLGGYNLSVEVPGFKRAEVQGIVVEVGRPSIINVRLIIGTVEEQVIVTGEQQSVINTVSATLTNVVSTRQVADLPLPSRNPMDLARLQAGIAVTGTDTRNASVGGMRGAGTYVTQDGINAMDNFVKTSSFFAISAPSVGATSEFSVTVGTVDPTGGRGLAQVRMVTKSGTNDLRGGLFWMHRNDWLNANTFFNNMSGTPRTIQRQNYFGFNVGGPAFLPKIYDGRNRSFWFFSYEGFREPFSVTRNRTVLSEDARKGLFKYTGSDGAEKSVNLLAIGNASALNTITTKMLNAMPPPNNSLVGDGMNTLGARFNVSGKDKNDRISMRFDQQLFQHRTLGDHKFEFVYNRAEFSLDPDTFNGLEAPFPGGVDAQQSSTRTLMAAAINSTFGARTTNEVRFGHQRAPVGFLRKAPPENPFFVSLASTSTYNNTFMSQGRNTLVYQFLDNFALIRGSHTIRLGMDFQSVTAITFNDAGIHPTVTLGTNSANPDGILNAAFPSLPSGTAGTAIVNRARSVFADLTGFLGSASQTFNVASQTSGFVPGASRDRNFKQRQLALYIQDQWRMRRNFIMNYGVRYEWQGVPYVTNGLAIQPANGVAGLYGISGEGNLFKPGVLKGSAPTSLNWVNGDTGIKLYNDDWNNFAPFLGFAYSPRSEWAPLRFLFGPEGKSSIRAGFSISYLSDGFTVVSNALGTGTTNPGLIQSSANNTPTGVLTSSGVPVTIPVFKMPVTDAENLLLNTNNGLWTFEPNLRVPYVQQWSLSIEREIAANTALEIRYAGNHGVKIFRAMDINEVNIFENGFLAEFLNAKKNLAASGGTNFSPVGADRVATPTLSTLFAGLSSGSAFSSSTFISNLNNDNVGAMASTLAFSSTYRANRANLAPNFFVANPNANFARALTNTSFSNYHSMSIEIRRRYSNGLYAQGSYTLSKTITDSAGSQSTLESPRTLRDLGLDRHRPSTDQTHRVIANFIYEMPFGSNKRFLSGAFLPIRKLVEGWSVGCIANWQSGPPVAIYSNRSTVNSWNAGLNPAQLLGMTFDEYKKASGIYRTGVGVFFIDPKYLNITTSPTTGRLSGATLKEGLLGSPAPGTFGNFPRNKFSGPSFTQWDFSLIKRTAFHENKNFELRVTFLNAFNQTNFIFGSANFDSSTFGQITSQRGSPRIIHFQLGINF